MDIRTYSTAVVSILASEETKKLRAENERLRNELAAMEAHWRNAESEATTAKADAAELGKALDMCIAERDGAFAEVDAQTLKANSFRGELHRYMQHAIELKDMLDISVAERDALRAELDNERNAHNATAAQLYAELAGAYDTVTAAAQAWRTVTDERDALRAELDTQAKRHAEIIDQWKAEENMWRYYDKKQLAQIDALRAELDAIRQAHSVIAARMEAMGC